MKYDIYVNPRLDRADPYYGIEIVPPIGELAATGLCKVLERGARESGRAVEPDAELAVMTRNDQDGTALRVYPYESEEFPHIPDVDDERQLELAAEDMAIRIRGVIDPTVRHDVTYHYVDLG
jgi:hypothetical protein